MELQPINDIYSHVIRSNDKWIELSCKTCGANHSRGGNGMFYKGVLAFFKHFTRLHKMNISSDEVLKHCNQRIVSEHDVLLMASNPPRAPTDVKIQMVEPPRKPRDRRSMQETSDGDDDDEPLANTAVRGKAPAASGSLLDCSRSVPEYDIFRNISTACANGYSVLEQRRRTGKAQKR